MWSLWTALFRNIKLWEVFAQVLFQGRLECWKCFKNYPKMISVRKLTVLRVRISWVHRKTIRQWLRGQPGGAEGLCIAGKSLPSLSLFLFPSKKWITHFKVIWTFTSSSHWAPIETTALAVQFLSQHFVPVLNHWFCFWEPDLHHTPQHYTAGTLLTGRDPQASSASILALLSLKGNHKKEA